MRLVDADKLLPKLWVCYEENKPIVDAEPTVEAIPIEWLLKKRDKSKEFAEKLGKEDLDIDFVAKYLYKRASREVLMMEELLLDWRTEVKEQEKENE